jgi:transmembrane sensor
MNQEQANKLIEEYNKGQASTEEKMRLDNWFLQESQKSGFDLDAGKFLRMKSEIWENTLKQTGLLVKPATRRIPIWSAVAAAVAFIVIGVVFFSYFRSGSLKNEGGQLANDIIPGGNKATLTLSNGKKISLAEAEKGSLARQAGVRITKLADGQIVYTIEGSADPSVAEMENTISTPNGGRYEIILPDGTKAVLNAASSLTFPAAFTGRERHVKLEGEAYFEVAKNKEMPFKVISGSQIVEVLGTHFNVSAYSNESSMKTTLLEGSVSVTAGQSSALIIPGQQSIVERGNTSAIITINVDVNKEIAWKNGMFSFYQDDLQSVMKQIARWYNVEVVYQGNLPEEKFYGEISRNSNLSEVAKILAAYNFYLEIKGKTVIVTYQPGLSRRAGSEK